jgi:RNA polymerase sigma factor (sigma-70 family)
MSTQKHIHSSINTINNMPDLNNLAKDYRQKLLYFVMRKVKNQDDAQDIVQYTFKEAFQSLHNFRSESKIETWITGIAVNLIKNHFYQKKHKPIYYLDDEDSQLEYQADDETPAVIFEKKQLMQDIHLAFQAMPSDMRTTAEKVLLHDLSYADAAKEEIIPIGTVRSRVARAREILRKMIDMEQIRFICECKN